MGAERKPQAGFKPKLIALSVAACFGVSATQTLANPTGGTAAPGTASFAPSGNTLTITNTANAIINWQSFSIAPNEITRFVQSSGSSAVLNRVVGTNGSIPQSVIDGLLQSTIGAGGPVGGRVFLLNPSGVVIGAQGKIDVAGFVASSLNLSDADFLAGKMRFTATPGAGAVTNAGKIDTSSAGPGGRVWLIAPDVQNSGVIRSPQGEIVLAAGKTVELVSEGTPFVTVSITAESERALNLGQLIADNGKIGMFGALVRQSGVAQADSAIVGPNGEIRLVATKDLTLDAGSRTTANGASGGTVTLQAQGGTNLVYGTVEAKGGSGQGGTIAALGVRVGVLGNGIIDASGEAGGGTVLVGGDQHGANPNVQNAQQTLIGPDGIIRADAATTGDGGRVIVWSDAYTQVYGTITARGGAQSGNGGFVETSSAGGLDLTGVRVDTRAPNGQWGTWLLDPTNVYLEANTYAGGGDPLAYASSFFTNPGTDTHITEQTVENGFNSNGTVLIQATNDVNFRTNLVLTYGTPNAGLFEVRALNNINLAFDGTPHTIQTNGHNVVLSANDAGPYAGTGLNTTSGTGSITGAGNIFTDYGGAAGGNIALSGYGVNVGALRTIGGVNPNGAPIGSVTITALNGGVKTGSITTYGANGADLIAANFIPPTAGIAGGAVNITSGYGTITTGDIDTTGGRGGNGGTVTGQAYAGAVGGAGGAVTIGTTTYGQTASINIASITTAGGKGGYGGSGASINTTAPSLDEGRGGDGGSGGNISLSANAVTAAAVKTTGGAGGAGGSNNNVTLTGVTGVTSSSGVLTVGFGGSGGGAGSLTVNGNGGTLQSITAIGGAGGAAGSGNSATVIVNAVAGNTQVIGEADSGFGGSGGAGGQVSLGVMGPTSVNGTIDTSGGAAAAGGANSVAKIGVYGLAIATFVAGTAKAGEGGGGNGAGTVSIGGSTVKTGDITAAASAGGAGGSNSSASAYGSSLIAVGSSFQTDAEAGQGGGGAGGGPSRTQVQLAGGDITTGAIITTGGAGGAGSTGSIATASGYAASSFPTTSFNENGLGGSGGSVIISAGAGNINIASFNTTGDGSGSVSISNISGDITTGTITTRTLSPAFSGGSVSITTSYGRIFVNGDIDARGSDGLTRFIDTCGDGCRGATYGGSSGGIVTLNRNGASDPTGGVAIQVSGSVLTSGGNGIVSPAAGGAGGFAGSVSITSIYGGAFYGAVIVGSIDASGGNGAAGATGFSGGAGGAGNSAVNVYGASVSVGNVNVSGGSGGVAGASGGNGPGASGAGGNAGHIVLLSYGNVATGSILATGGDGGNGAANTLVAGLGSAGGYGGIGGTLAVTTTASTAAVSTGTINVSGGRGGKGGDSPTGIGGAGGLGGGSGTINIDPNSATIGAITATGGAGGAGGYGGTTGGLGGAGGVGATITILGIPYGGSIAVGTIDASGGAGGSGGGSGGVATLGGSGGTGGVGGTVSISGGSIDLSAAPTVNALGGAGGAGGSGTAGFGGTGGNGGVGGLLDLTATGSTSVLASLNDSLLSGAAVSGGAGGAGGATGGLKGASGINGSTSYGILSIVSPTLGLDGSTVIQSTQQAANAANTNNAPSSDEQQKKDKKSNQVAACK